MAGGTKPKAPTGYFETEYSPSWSGIDVSAPSNFISAGSCTSSYGMLIRGGLANQPAIQPPQGSEYPIILPTLANGEVIGLITNLSGSTILVTNFKIYADFATPTSTAKTFTSIYTFPSPYSQAVHFGSVVIGNNIYLSSAEQLGVYSIYSNYSVSELILLTRGAGYTTAGVSITGGGGTGATGTVEVYGDLTDGWAHIPVLGGGTVAIALGQNAPYGTAIPFEPGYDASRFIGFATAGNSFSPTAQISGVNSASTSGGILTAAMQNRSNGVAYNTNVNWGAMAWTADAAVTLTTIGTLTYASFTTALGDPLVFVAGQLGNTGTVSVPATYTAANFISIVGPSACSNTGNGLQCVNVCALDPSLTLTMLYGDNDTHLWAGSANVFGVFYKPSTNVVASTVTNGSAVTISIDAYQKIALVQAFLTNSSSFTFPAAFTGGQYVTTSAMAAFQTTSGDNVAHGWPTAALTDLTWNGVYQDGEGHQWFGKGHAFAVIALNPIKSITLTDGGTGYQNPPNVTITGDGTGATAKAVLTPSTGFSVTEITDHNGSGPFIGGDFLATISGRLVMGNIIGGDGNQTGSVTSVTVDDGGSGYPDSGLVTFQGGGGQNASGTFVASGGVVTSITITNEGSGYITAPEVTIVSTSGSGFTGTANITFAITASSNTRYRDYFAWSFPNAYGYFDPNSILLGGGFQQLTEARGKITGIAVFESVCFVAHNGGFTEVTPNVSSGVGANIAPFTYNPLWSADQGVVCRYGSLAQYGAMCMFLGQDQTYQLSPAGLKPFADSVASLVQDFSLWRNGSFPDAGLYGSIIEIEGEKHYLVGFSADDPTLSGDASRRTLIFDFNLKTGACFNWNYPNITMTCPVYQSYDSQTMQGEGGGWEVIDKDNLLLIGLSNTGDGFISSQLGQIIAGQQLYSSNPALQIAADQFNFQFRTETPAIGRDQTNRGFYIEYENIPALAGTAAALTLTLTGQSKPDSTGKRTNLTDTITVDLPYLALSASVPPYAVFTAFVQPNGTAFDSLSTTISLSSPDFLRLIRIDMYGETTESTLQ